MLGNKQSIFLWALVHFFFTILKYLLFFYAVNICFTNVYLCFLFVLLDDIIIVIYITVHSGEFASEEHSSSISMGLKRRVAPVVQVDGSSPVRPNHVAHEFH